MGRLRRRDLIPLALSAVLLAAASPARANPSDAVVASDLDFARTQLRVTAGETAVDAYPSRTTASGAWETREPSWWTSGFYPGSLWLAYRETGDPWWRAEAERRQAGLESQKGNTSTHDVGFMLMSTYGNAYRETGADAYRQVVLDAARSLATRFSPTVGCTRSWGSSSAPEFTVIVDNMMNLELLFRAAAMGGDPAWREMAISHALRTREHFVRPDGGTYHVVDFDPGTGAVERKHTHQGLSAESTWSRGQAWALYGFTVAYRETGDERFLDTARRTADFFTSRLPADHVPYWDFDAAGPGEPRDSSAAAIAASGLLELSRLEADPGRSGRYRDAAGGILDTLSSSYLARGTPSRSILLHGTGSKPHGDVDEGYAFGDYYFIEALLRWRGAPAPAPARPKLALRLPRGSRSLARLLRRGLPVRVHANMAGRVTASLTLARRTARRLRLAAPASRMTVARRARKISKPGWVTIRLRPGRRAVRRLRHVRSLPARVGVRLVASDGRRATARRSMRFQRRGQPARTTPR